MILKLPLLEYLVLSPEGCAAAAEAEDASLSCARFLITRPYSSSRDRGIRVMPAVACDFFAITGILLSVSTSGWRWPALKRALSHGIRELKETNTTDLRLRTRSCLRLS